mmetsp:Transcript_12192/g.10495  ORF Transcript_12192/g.10495 Transcript_12192/m.10495 type:complete len:138 (-) Transcript_12192:483-896(-)
MNKHLAAKLYLRKNGEESPYYINAKKIAKLQPHPSIIKHISTQDEASPLLDNNNPFKVSLILMEYAHNHSLYDEITTNETQFDDILTRTIFHRIVEGVEHLHQNGLAHLDIKPENIVLTKEFEPKIIDFDTVNGGEP